MTAPESKSVEERRAIEVFADDLARAVTGLFPHIEGLDPDLCHSNVATVIRAHATRYMTQERRLALDAAIAALEADDLKRYGGTTSNTQQRINTIARLRDSEER